MSGERTPIAIFAYNRPLHLARLIECLKKDDEALQSSLFFFSDGPRGDSRKISEVRQLIRGLKAENVFPQVNISEKSTNMGLAKSIISGVTEVFERYNRIIVLEDDLVLREGAIRFLKEALDFYEAEPRVFGATAYRFPGQGDGRIGFGRRFSSWMWATWKDRWHKVDWNVSDFEDFLRNRKLQFEFNRGGDDLTEMLTAQMRDKINSWAIRMNYAQFKNNALTLYPAVSMIENLGFDDSGTHCNSSFESKFFSHSRNISTEKEFQFPTTIEPDLQIDRAIRKTFHRSFASKVKRKIRGFVGF